MRLHTLPYRVVQPYGLNRSVEATVQSEHATAEEAFAAIDAIAERMVATGVRSDFIELIVVDNQDRIVQRRVS